MRESGGARRLPRVCARNASDPRHGAQSARRSSSVVECTLRTELIFALRLRFNQPVLQSPLMADFVAKVVDGFRDQ